MRSGLFATIVDQHRNPEIGFQQAKGCLDDGVLCIGLIGPAQRVAVREWNAQRARGADPLCDEAKQLDRHGRDATALEFRCDQAHGLVAHRSDRDEKRYVDTVCDEAVRYRRCTLVRQSPGRREASHEREVALID